jgi:hypothetical protein
LKSLAASGFKKEVAARVHLGTSKTANTKLFQHMGGEPANDPTQARLGV